MNDADVLRALRTGLKYAKRAKADMLCSVGGLSDKAFDRVQQEPYWVEVMSDVERIEDAIREVS